MKVGIALTFEVGGKSYSAGLKIPEGDISAKNPFLFSAVQMNENGQGSPILEVAVGDKDHVYVGVMPPESVMQLAHIDSVVKELRVEVAEGNFSLEKHEFLLEE